MVSERQKAVACNWDEVGKMKEENLWAWGDQQLYFQSTNQKMEKLKRMIEQTLTCTALLKTVDASPANFLNLEFIELKSIFTELCCHVLKSMNRSKRTNVQNFRFSALNVSLKYLVFEVQKQKRNNLKNLQV